jgi:hypothetical protein
VSWLHDDALRGAAVDIYDEIQGARYDQYGFKTFVFADTICALFRAALGSTDTVTGTAAPYTHTIGLQNDQVGSQPPSYTIYWFDGAVGRQISGAQLDTLDLSFTADGKAEVSTKWVANIENDKPYTAPSFSTQKLVPGWDCAITLGTVAAPYIMSGSVNIKRGTKPIFVSGSQGPLQNFAGPLNVSGKFMFVMGANDQTMANGLTRDQQYCQLTFTDPASGYTVTVHMTTTQLENPKVDVGKEWVQVGADFKAVPNTTDDVTGQYSQIRAVVNNGVSSAF